MVMVPVFAAGRIDEDAIDSPRYVAFEGALHEESSSSFSLGQLMKIIHGENNRFDEEEALQALRKDQRRRTPFYLSAK